MEEVAFEVGLKGWMGFKHMEKGRMTSQGEEYQTP